MTYREKLELYSQGKLDEKQRIEIERELEKQEALADYLFEHDAPPGIDEPFGMTSPFGVEGNPEEETIQAGQAIKDDSENIARQINSSIRRAFIKTGTIAAAIAVIITLFVVFALPHIVSGFYYNPSKSIGTDENGTKIEQFEQDMSVYSEMFLPELGPQISVGTDSYGYGNYSYYLDARFETGTQGQYETTSRVFTGNIKRNSLVCYNYDELESFNKQESYFNSDADAAAKSLKQMNDTDLYYAYVKLNEEVPYEKFYADYVNAEEYGTNGSWVWCGVRVSESEEDNGYYNEGFYATPYTAFADYDYDSSKYPALAWQEDSAELNTEKKATEHFSSMIRYLSESGEFAELGNHLDIGNDLWSIDGTEEYVTDNGLNVYGFIYVGDKEHINAISEAEGVSQVSALRAD